MIKDPLKHIEFLKKENQELRRYNSELSEIMSRQDRRVELKLSAEIERNAKLVGKQNIKFREALTKIYQNPNDPKCTHVTGENCSCDAIYCSNIALQALNS